MYTIVSFFDRDYFCNLKPLLTNSNVEKKLKLKSKQASKAMFFHMSSAQPIIWCSV